MQTLDTLEVYNNAKAFRKEVIKTANIAEGYGRYHYQEAIRFAELPGVH
ncbi:MAG: hypothetical protein AAB221_12720 [Bacteroidota bacterium]